MNNTIIRLVTLCASLLSWTAAHAALNMKIVPADSKWVVNVDFNALRESQLGRQLIEMAPPVNLVPENDTVRPNFQKILETIGTVTAFGTNLSGQPEAIDGTLVVQGSGDLRTIVEGFIAQITLAQPELLTEIADLPFEAYAAQGGLVIALPPEPIVMLSKSREQLLKALDVYRGKGPSMMGSTMPPASLLPTSGTYFFAASFIVPSSEGMFPANAPQARILQMADSASIAIGEEAERTVAHAQLNASSDDVADKLTKIVQGLVAMASLAETSDEALTDFINSVNIRREGTLVKLDLSYPTARITDMIATIQREAQARPQRSQDQETPQPLNPPGTVLAEWTADQDLGSDATSPDDFVTKTIENVQLTTGATLVLTGQRNSGENARFDYAEIVPTDGSARPMRFEAEYMRLSNYRIEQVSFASGGEVIIINGNTGNARFHFPGASGSYSLNVRYVDENDGNSNFAVSILEPETPSGQEQSNEQN